MAFGKSKFTHGKGKSTECHILNQLVWAAGSSGYFRSSSVTILVGKIPGLFSLFVVSVKIETLLLTHLVAVMKSSNNARAFILNQRGFENERWNKEMFPWLRTAGAREQT